MRRLVLPSFLVLVALLGVPAPVSALTCASPSGPRFAGGDVAIEGVALSGRPASGRALVGPTRVLVTRYLKGAGPAVVRATTGAFVTKEGYRGAIGGAFSPSAGDTVRVVGDRSHGGRFTVFPGPVPPGTIVTSFCDPDTKILRAARGAHGPQDDRLLLNARRAGALLAHIGL